ncbi:MAG TPA: hypothetical protein VIW45_09350 [Vicinamibacterales bacterium]
MRMMTRAAAVVSVLAFAHGASAQSDPNVGTWKLNVAKSTYNGGTAPKSSTVVIESANDGKGIKSTANVELADGTKRTITFTANYDGKDAAVSGTPDYNMTSMTRKGNTTTGVRRRGARRAYTFTIVVSPDGKTRTATVKGTDAMGKAVNMVQVFEKQ